MTTQREVEPQALAQAGTWNVDAIHSQVLVSVRHMAVTQLRAKFPRIAGKLEVDRDDPLRSTFELEADTRAVTTGQPAQEDFMRSEPWLDAENHPTFTFRSTAIEPQGGSGYVVKGDLTLKGVTRPVAIPLEFHGVVADPWGLRAGFTSRFTLDRRDFGITWNREFDWGVMAGWDMEVSLDIELSHPDETLAQRPKS
ncbi:MAG TPA: YceI family protein [Candidatus Dormibacteraeota bacterium]